MMAMDPQIRVTLKLALDRDIRELRRITRQGNAEGESYPFLEEELKRAYEAREYLKNVYDTN